MQYSSACGIYQDFLDRGLLLTRKLLNQGFLVVITSKVLRSPPWLGWPLWNICVTNDHGYVPLVISTSRSFPHSWFITGFVTRLTRRVTLVDQEHLTRSLVLCVCFVDRCVFFCTFSFGHCVICSFFDVRILITPLVSSNSSQWIWQHGTNNLKTCNLTQYFRIKWKTANAIPSKLLQNLIQKMVEIDITDALNTHSLSCLRTSTSLMYIDILKLSCHFGKFSYPISYINLAMLDTVIYWW